MLNPLVREERETTRKDSLIFIIISASLFLSCGLSDGKSAVKEDLYSQLTREERIWLDNHPVITVAPDPDFRPVEFINSDGVYQGASADMLAALGTILGVRIEAVNTEDWNDSLEQFKSGEADLLGALVRTKEREKWALFTEAIVVVPGGIFTAGDYRYGAKLIDFAGKKAAVVENYTAHGLLLSKYPEIELIPVGDVVSGLAKASSGVADIYVENIANATYYVQKSGITNLKLVGYTDFLYQWSIAVNPELPELRSILNKGLALIPEDEKKDIVDRWISVSILNSQRDLKDLLILLLCFLVILLFFSMIWTSKLRKSVEKRKKAELEAVASEKLVTSVLNAIPSPVFYKDREGRYRGCNPAYSRVSGYTIDDIIGRRVDELFDDELHRNIQRGDMELMENPRHLIFEDILVDKDGVQTPILLGRDVIRDESGDVTGMVAGFFDISNLKKVERELEDSQDRFRNVVEQSIDGIVLIDRQGFITLWNKAQESITGYRRDDVLGKKIWDVQFDLIPSEIKDKAVHRQLETAFRRSLEGEHAPLNYKFQDQTIERKNGEKIITQTVSFKIKIKDGFLIGNINKNVTERRKAEMALKDNERRYREIFNATSEAILIINETDESIIDANNSMIEIFGYRMDELMGMKLEDLVQIHSQFNKQELRTHLAECRSGSISNFECQMEHKTHAPLWIAVSLKKSWIGDTNRILAVLRDISQKKRNQELLIQNEKMMSVGGLAAGMAHEINNPLGGIMQSVGVLNMRLYSDEGIEANKKAAEEAGISLDGLQQYMALRKIPRILEGINDSGRRIVKIVDNILSFSRKGDDSRQGNSLNDLLEKGLELASTDYDLKKDYDFKQIHVEKNLAPDMPDIYCEGSKIQQVIINILRNGAQAMRESQIEDPRFDIETAYRKKSGCVEVSIRNNGPHIEESVQKRIFEPFFTTKPVGIGTGLGLSVSYFIIKENHGGDLWVESSPEEGVTFKISLPVR